MPDSFTNTRYPSVQETLINNASSLHKQKRQYLADLRTLMGTSGYVLMGIVYLRDLSILIFLLRVITQFFLSAPIAMQFQYVPVLRDELRGEQRWFLFWTVVSANVTGLLYHGLFGSYKESRASDHQLHGGMTLQFIGERLPYNRMELLLLDCGIFILQLLYFCLMCTTEDSEVVQGQASSFASIEDTISSDIVSDGFDGNVNLLTIDVWASIQASWRHERSPVSPEDFAALTSFRERALRRMAV